MEKNVREAVALYYQGIARDALAVARMVEERDDIGAAVLSTDIEAALRAAKDALYPAAVESVRSGNAPV